VQVPAKYLPKFKVGKELRERVDYVDERPAPHHAAE
jgi:nucleoid DNA-binding protein